MLAAASANIAFNCDLVNSSGCLTPGLRVDTILSTGRAQAANSKTQDKADAEAKTGVVGHLCPPGGKEGVAQARSEATCGIHQVAVESNVD